MTTERFCQKCPAHLHLFQSNGMSLAEADYLRKQNRELSEKVEAQARLINKLRGKTQGAPQRAS